MANHGSDKPVTSLIDASQAARKRRAKERRFDEFGAFRVLAEAEGWVLVRRIGRSPSAMTVAHWESLELCRDNVVPLTAPPCAPEAQTGMEIMEALRETRRQGTVGEISPRVMEHRIDELRNRLRDAIHGH